MSPRERAFLFPRFSSGLVAWCNSGPLGIATSCGAQQSGVGTGGSAIGAVEGGAGKGDSFTCDAAIGLHGATREILAHARAAARRRRAGVASGRGGRWNRGGPASYTVQLSVRLTTVASCTVQLTTSLEAVRAVKRRPGCTVQLQRSHATTTLDAGAPVAGG